MKGWRSKTVSAIREEFDEINDSMKSSSSRMKTKVSKKRGVYKDETRKYVCLSMVVRVVYWQSY